MAKRNTKELISDVALRLFSERGYDGVGLREIASEVGIRESAIYKHYRGKQDVFDSIIMNMEKLTELKMESVQVSEKMAAAMQGGEAQESLFKMCLLMFGIYLQDEKGSRLRRMLTIEQVKNTEAGKAFSDKLINNALEYISNVFQALIEQGCYKKADPRVMALQFYAPLYLLLLKYDRQPEKHGEALEELEKHIEQFDLLYREENL